MISKTCTGCGNIYMKNPKYSAKQWVKSKFCSSSCFGRVPKSSEFRRKISAALSGIKHTEQSRKNMSIGRMGMRLSESHKMAIWRSNQKALAERGDEIRQKLRLANLGRKMSPISIAKMIASAKLRTNYKGGEETRRQRMRFYEKRRRVRKFQNGGWHSLEEWEKLKDVFGFTCPMCFRKEPEIKLTEDHIVPLTKGGSDDLSNIQPLCFSCNSKKKTRIIKYEPYITAK